MFDLVVFFSLLESQCYFHNSVIIHYESWLWALGFRFWAYPYGRKLINRRIKCFKYCGTMALVCFSYFLSLFSLSLFSFSIATIALHPHYLCYSSWLLFTSCGQICYQFLLTSFTALN